MSRLWRYQPLKDRLTTYRVDHPDGVVVSDLGEIEGWDYFVAEDTYAPTHPRIAIEEVVPSPDILNYLMARSRHAQLLAQRMESGPPRYSAEDEARLTLFIGYIPGLEAHIAAGRAWESGA